MSPEESGGGVKPPVPDPTILTTEQLLRVAEAERDYVKGEVRAIEARLDAIDKATSLLSETVNRVPTEVTKEVMHSRALNDEMFHSVQVQFKERDERSERESRDNKVAVDAAFAAQKEAAAKQDEANQKSIDKSEAGTAEAINKLAQLFETTLGGLRGTLDDVKLRVGSMEAVIANGHFNRSDSRASNANVIAIIGVIVTALLVGAALIGLHK
jgi:cation transport regulator ChaB